MNARIKKKRHERWKNEAKKIMIYNRAHIEWAYAKYLPEFKTLRNYQKAVKYRLNYCMKNGGGLPSYLSSIYKDRRNCDYIYSTYPHWAGPRQMELSAKHIIHNDGSWLSYREKYSLIRH